MDKNKQTELKKLVDRFVGNLKQYEDANYKEFRVRADFIDPFFELLDWDMGNKQGFSEAYRDVIREDEVMVAGKQKAPDYCFKIGVEKKFFVEAKKPSVDIKKDIGAAYQLRRYAYSAKLPLSILTDFHEFAVYDTRIKPRPKDKADVARIFYCKFDEYDQKFDYIYDTFSKSAILKGSFDRYVADTKKKKGTSEVDKEFLKLIEDWRNDLAKNIAINNLKLDLYSLNTAVQKIIDRIIFLRIAEARNIEPEDTLSNLAESANIYKKLDAYFQQADKRYNSGLFKIEGWLSSLKIDDKILKSIIISTYYPESPYEFSVLPVEILGNIYEQFLGKVIHLTATHQAKIEEKPEVKKAGGVYYTPQYIVDYIVKNTVGEKLKDSTPEKVEALKILDPACGSGSFLLGAYAYLLRWHLDFYTKDKKSLEKFKKAGKIYDYKGDFKLTIDEKKKILKNNIFGVDIDGQAVEVTKLSLLLKLMEDETQQSAGMLIKYSKEALLPDLSDNIKCGNSLIGSDFYGSKNMSLFGNDEMRKVNAFDWEKQFKDIFGNGGFDVVIGNPPYVVLGADDFGILYYKNNYKVSHGGKTNLYKLFIEKSYILLKKTGLLGFICPSNYLSSADSLELRRLLLNNTRLIEIIEYTEKDRVFENVTQALTTIIFQKINKGDSKFHLVTSKHGDVSGEQSQFLKNDGLVFVFYNKVISKIKRNVHKFDEFIDGYQGEINVSIHKNSFIKIAKPGYLPLLRGNLISCYYLVSKPEEYCPLSIDKRSHWKIDRIAFQEVSNQQQPRRVKGIIVSSGILCGHTTNYCFSKDNSVSNNMILALLNSRVINYYFSYFNNTNHVPIGEIKSIPFPVIDGNVNEKVSKLVDQMVEVQKRFHSAKNEADKKLYQQKIEILDGQIDGEVYKLYGLTEEEIKIVEGK